MRDFWCEIDRFWCEIACQAINNDVDRLITVKVNTVEASHSDNTTNITKTTDTTNSNTSDYKYKCELCDFVSQKEAGLNIHMSRKHVTL